MGRQGIYLDFRCWRCRRAPSRDAQHGWLNRVLLLRGTRRRGSHPVQRGYQCKDCGHRGWSSHSQLAATQHLEL